MPSKQQVLRLLLCVALFVCGLSSARGWLYAQREPQGETSEAENVVTDSSEAVAEGRRALTDSWSYPWYDKNKDDVRSLSIPPTQVPPPPPPPAAPNTTASDFQWLAWFLLAMLVVIILLIIVKLVAQPDERRLATPPKFAVQSIGSQPLPVELPMELSPVITDRLAEARRLAGIGNTGAAINYLYAHILIRLSEADLIHPAKGMTNRQFAVQLSDRPDLRAVFTTAMRLFEAHFFGDHPPRPEQLAGTLAAWDVWEATTTRLAGFTTGAV